MTPKPLVERDELRSNCCNAEIMAVGDETSYWVCQKCNKACDPSETNEADYLKEFDERFTVKTQGPCSDACRQYFIAFRNFLEYSIERARREGYKDGFEKGSNASHSVFEPNFEVLK